MSPRQTSECDLIWNWVFVDIISEGPQEDITLDLGII